MTRAGNAPGAAGLAGAFAWAEAPAMLFENNRKIAARFFRQPIGMLAPGAAADIIVCDYQPITPLNADNLNAHVLFGLNGRSVITTVAIPMAWASAHG